MISVCIATYNGEKYLKEQLNSILLQLDTSDEIIVSDDGSTDQTRRIIEEYTKKDSRIQFVEGPKRGVVANFEHALAMSTGDIVFLADQDDVWQPNKVKTMINYFDSHPNIQLVVSDLMIVDESLETINASYFEYRKVREGFVHNIIKNKYIGAGMAFRRSLLKRALPFPSNVPMHDMWLGLLAAFHKQSALIAVPLTLYRRHDHNASEIQSKASVLQQIKWRSRLIIALIKRLVFSD